MDTSGDILYLAELFLITLKSGTTMYLTTYAFDITFEGNTYLRAPIKRTKMTKKSDLSVGQIRITFPRLSPWVTPSKLRSRYLDNATVLITWIDRTNHTNKRVTFKGVAGEMSYNQTTVEVTFKNHLNVFQKYLPPRKYTEGCGHTMYDDGCKLVRATYEVTGAAEAGSTVSQIIDSTRVEADNYFDLGIIEFTSGLNNGEKRWVASYYLSGAAEVIDMFDELPNVPQVGDTYKMVPHCKKNLPSCRDDYNNEDNYGGFEDIPDPQVALV